jgi:hypothetical protein
MLPVLWQDNYFELMPEKGRISRRLIPQQGWTERGPLLLLTDGTWSWQALPLQFKPAFEPMGGSFGCVRC